MENKKFKNYYLLSLLGVILASCYPIYMGITVIVDMIRYGTVYAENYPKYIIPYTPIAISLLVGVALIPIATKYFKKYALLGATTISTAIFLLRTPQVQRIYSTYGLLTPTIAVTTESSHTMIGCIRTRLIGTKTRFLK